MNASRELPSPSEPGPIVAILRGIRPPEVADIARRILEHGITTIEIPLNSPDPFQSIARLVEAVGDHCLCGAGTVLTPEQVDRTRDAGGRLIVSPNTNDRVIARAAETGLLPMPGFATATEAFRAIEAGARHLKLFPAHTYGPDHLRSLRAVVPPDIRIFAVGGIETHAVPRWRAAGADGFGVGSGLYKPGSTPDDVGTRAQAWAAAGPF